MKRLTNFLWLAGIMMLLPLGFTSCSDDDDDEGGSGSKSDLIGTWLIVSDQGWEKENGVLVDEWNWTDNDIKYTLKADGTYIRYELYSNAWHIEENGTWEYKGGKLYTTYYDEYEKEEVTESSTVTKLTSEIMEFEGGESYKENGITYEWYNYIIYRKISE